MTLGAAQITVSIVTVKTGIVGHHVRRNPGKVRDWGRSSRGGGEGGGLGVQRAGCRGADGAGHHPSAHPAPEVQSEADQDGPGEIEHHRSLSACQRAQVDEA